MVEQSVFFPRSPGGRVGAGWQTVVGEVVAEVRAVERCKRERMAERKVKR